MEVVGAIAAVEGVVAGSAVGIVVVGAAADGVVAAETIGRVIGRFGADIHGALSPVWLC